MEGNRRALSLSLCAPKVVGDFDGRLPGEASELEKLPGIGPYTARAIAAFPFGRPTVFIETNIRSAFLHHFVPDREKVPDREIMPLIELTLDCQQPRHWYYALMAYGCMLKKTGANPGRRSAHHVRQSPFRGSTGEKRSQILGAILDSPGMSEEELRERLRGDDASIGHNLQALEREGFVRQVSGRYWIG